MSAIDVVMALADAMNSQDWGAATAQMTDDFSVTGLAPFPLSKAQLIEGEQAWHAASPDRHITVDQAREVEDGVLAALTVSGTQTNTLALPDLPAIPATGKAYAVKGTMTVTVRGNLVAGIAVETTSPDVLQQLGVQLPEG